jgi:hypothetical protein
MPRRLSTRYTRPGVHDDLSLGEWDGFETSPVAPSFEATLRFATALVQDGVSGVTVIVPRAPGVLTRARAAARLAGVRVRADHVGSATITMRFSGQRPPVAAARESAVPNRKLAPPPTGRGRQRWSRLLGWIALARV